MVCEYAYKVLSPRFYRFLGQKNYGSLLIFSHYLGRFLLDKEIRFC